VADHKISQPADETQTPLPYRWIVPATTRKEPHVHAPELYFDLPRPPRLLGLIALLLALAEIADAFSSASHQARVFATLLLAGTLWTPGEGDAGGRSSRRAVRIRDRKRPFWRARHRRLITTIAYGVVALAGLLVAAP